MVDDEWLQSLAVGDTVVLAGGWEGVQIAKVERASPTLLTVNGIRYRRNSGWPTGHGYSRKFLRKPTPEAMEEAERNRLVRKLSETKWPKIPLPQLRAIHQILSSMDSGEVNG